MLNFSRCFFFLSILFSFPLLAQDQEVLSGWFPAEPYMQVEQSKDVSKLTGLDIQMVEAVLNKTHHKVTFSQSTWKEILADLKEGKKTLAPFATQTKEREEWAYFSEPYRWEENVLYVQYGSQFQFRDLDDFLRKIKETNFRLGVIDGFVYADKRVNDFINDPQNSHLIIKTSLDLNNLNNLLQNKIDGFLADRLIAATLVWRSGARQSVEERLLNISTPIHFIISKAAATPAFVEEVNKTILKMKASDEHSAIMRQYILPVLLMQTIDRPWFLWIEVLAIIAFVLSGIIIADRENLSIISTFGLSVVPAFGGGLLRDIIVNRSPVGILVTPRYIFIVMTCFTITILALNFYDFLRYRLKIKWVQNFTIKTTFIHRIVDIFDAIGTSAFTVIGVLVAVLGKATPLWVWGPILAVMTGIGGSTIRNLLAGYRALGNEYTYAEIPLLCGLGLALFLNGQTEKIDPNLIFTIVIATIVCGFIAHILVNIFKVPSIKIRFFSQNR